MVIPWYLFPLNYWPLLGRGPQPNWLFTRICLNGFVMSPCCYHARSRYVVNCGGRKRCKEGKRCSRNASDNSRRVMTSWWQWWLMAWWNPWLCGQRWWREMYFRGGWPVPHIILHRSRMRQHWNKAEQLRPVAVNMYKNDQGLSDLWWF